MGAWLMGAGVVLMIVGVFMRPQDEPWEWDRFWGLAGGSTWMGKAVVCLGVIVLIVGGRIATGRGVPIVSPIQNKCFANLGKIEIAKDTLAINESIASGTRLTPAQVEKMGTMIPGGWPAVKCGLGGTYEIGAVGEPARCTVHNRKTR
jgi:hypothetical protein